MHRVMPFWPFELFVSLCYTCAYNVFNFLLYFLRTSSVGGGGGGGGAARLPLFVSLFPVQQAIGGIGHRVKYKQLFRVGKQNTLNARNNNKMLRRSRCIQIFL